MIKIPEFGPLRGLKVVLSGTAYAGPVAAGIMADYGAEVISVESARAPDMVRGGQFFEAAHRNQKAIALNIPTPEGKEIFLKLLKKTDIFIENAKAGQWDKWGLSDEELWKVNPKLVIAHASGFGQTGDPEYTSRGSYDPIGQAFGGTMSMNGMPDGPELNTNPYTNDYLTALCATWGCLAGYIYAQKTGKGDSIDLAQYETAVYFMADAVMNWCNKGVSFKRPGSGNAKYGAWGPYRCKDGNVYMAPAGQGAITKGLNFLGLTYPSDIFPEGMQMFPAGSEAAELVGEKLTEWCAAHTMEEADNELNKVGLLCSQIMTHDKMEEHPHYKAREVITEWTDIEGKTIKGPNAVFRFKNNPTQIWRGAPKYGMDNEEVLSALGYSDAEIKAFYDGKILVKENK